MDNGCLRIKVQGLGQHLDITNRTAMLHTSRVSHENHSDVAPWSAPDYDCLAVTKQNPLSLPSLHKLLILIQCHK